MITQERLNRLKVINGGTNDSRSMAVLELIQEVETLRQRNEELSAALKDLNNPSPDPRPRTKSVYK